MKVEIKDSNKKQLQLCDLLHFKDRLFEGEIYIVLKENNGYIARSIDKSTGATGYHNTIEDLKKSITPYEYTHYSKDDFKLVLERIQS